MVCNISLPCLALFVIFSSPAKGKLAGMQKKGYKSDWLSHGKKEELDESTNPLNATKTSKVCSIHLFIHLFIHFFQKKLSLGGE